MRRAFLAGMLSLTALGGGTARAEESQQPYIDSLKESMRAEDRDSEPPPGGGALQPYIDRQKRKLESKAKDDEEPKYDEGYIEHLRATDPTLSPVDDDETVANPARSYVDKQKAKLGPPEGGSAIEAVKEGRSELQGKRSGEIHNALAFQLNASNDLSATGSSDLIGKEFQKLYGSGYAPRLAVQYEYQPMHSEWFGSVGILIGAAITYHDGEGKFDVNLVNPVTGEKFGLESKTRFNFITVPTTLGLNYRLNVARYVRPYFQGTGLATFYRESRNDSQDGHRGVSFGFTAGGGLNFLLDWISRESTWAFYRGFDVKHYYLTLDYTRTQTFAMSKRVNFAANTISLGLTFEY